MAGIPSLVTVLMIIVSLIIWFAHSLFSMSVVDEVNKYWLGQARVNEINRANKTNEC